MRRLWMLWLVAVTSAWPALGAAQNDSSAPRPPRQWWGTLAGGLASFNFGRVTRRAVGN